MAQASSTKSIIFDVGHVLYDWDIRYLYEKLIDDPDRLDWFLANVVTREWHFQSDRGRPLAEMVPELIAQYPDERALIEAYHPRWLETIGAPIPGMLDLVARIDAAGIPIFGITNFGAEFWDMFRPTAPVFDRFRDIIVSGREQLMKPDPAIYRLAIDRFGVEPSQTLFIDDREDNVAGAKALGFQAHRFEGRAGAERAIEALGIDMDIA
ncbi:MAG: HAD family phosphatase [Pseudomonadota bacterium]